MYCLADVKGEKDKEEARAVTRTTLQLINMNESEEEYLAIGWNTSADRTAVPVLYGRCTTYPPTKLSSC